MAGTTQMSRKVIAGSLATFGLLVAACATSNSDVGTTTTAERPGVGRSTAPITAPMLSASPASTTVARPATTGIQVGPGPQMSYVVQPQPVPGSCHYTYVGSDPLPDPNCTPGAVNPQVTQANIGSTICQSGYTSTIRPPEGVTGEEKVASAAAYGYTGTLHTAEYDHLISLELGGDPNDPSNLWVEPNDRGNAASTYNTKDALENRLNGLVCSGQITLVAAQRAIATNWVAAYRKYGT